MNTVGNVIQSESKTGVKSKRFKKIIRYIFHDEYLKLLKLKMLLVKKERLEIEFVKAT